MAGLQEFGGDWTQEKLSRVSSETSKMREKAIDAADLLSDFVCDLITGVMTFREFTQRERMGKIPPELMTPALRMCMSHLVLTLNKWLEFYDKYHSLIPSEHRQVVKDLNTILKKKKVREFRHMCIGHIWDKDNNRPLMHSEIMERLDLITDGDLGAFFSWINDPQKLYPNTVATIMDTLRASIMESYDISPNEFVQR